MISLASSMPSPTMSSTVTLTEHIKRQYQRMARHQRPLANVACCFRDQAAMLPLQCQEATARLYAMRRDTQHVSLYLATLPPHETQILRPYGAIEILAQLEGQLTEVIVALAMFEPVCQVVVAERIGLHLYIRSMFQHLLHTYDVVLVQLSALMSLERMQSGSQEVCR